MCLFSLSLALLQQKVDDVSQLTERHRSEHERSFHLVSIVLCNYVH